MASVRSTVVAVQHGGRTGPHPEGHRHLRDVVLAQMVQRAKERGLAAVAFVEGQPRKANAVAQGPTHLAQGDLPLGPIDHLVGNPGLTAAAPVRVPGRLRQIQLAVQQRVEVRRGVTEMHADDAVLYLAHGPAMLPLDARRLPALLHEARR